MQGVSINIFVKTGRKKSNELGKVFHFDLFGKRELKYDFLFGNSIINIGYKEILADAPNYYFVPKDLNEEEGYSKGFELTALMPFKTSGIKTHDDINLVSDSRERLEKNVISLNQQFDNSKVYKYSYRPFDNGYIYYDTKLLGRAREKTIYHLKNGNIGLVLVAQPQAANLKFFDCAFITNCFTDTNMFRRGGPCVVPLYIYPTSTIQQTVGNATERVPNLNMDIVEKIAHKLNLCFVEDDDICVDLAAGAEGTFYPMDILDYIYAVLYSPTYRDKYKEFLKIDFPKVPYPKDKDTFWKLVELGGELRQIHLLESPVVDQFITRYPVDGDNIVTKIEYREDNVFINETQYFANVPEITWNFYIGGYQPAQKWLKDRKGRTLQFDDISHYQKIIVALFETDRLMKEIDLIEIE